MFVLASLFTQKNALRLVKTKQDFFSNAKEEEFHYLYGVNPVEAAIHAKKRILTTLFISDSENVELNSKITNLMKHARSIELPIVFTSKDKLSRIVKGQPHQNIVLKCSPLPVRKWILHSFKFGFGVYVFCDKISDPQNFGAIFRSSLFFGARTIFTGKKGHCPLNETVSKTSSGAM